MKIQLAPYIFRLQREFNISLHFVDGRRPCAPHPSLVGFYDGPTYENYSWDDDHGPPTEENKVAVRDAFQHVYNTIECDGPFDGAIGFSQGASCLAGFILHHERSGKGPQTDLFKFIILFSTSGIPEWDIEPGSPLKISIPSLHIASEKDFEWFADSREVYQRAGSETAQWLEHASGHSVPKDKAAVEGILGCIGRLVALQNNKG